MESPFRSEGGCQGDDPKETIAPAEIPRAGHRRRSRWNLGRKTLAHPRDNLLRDIQDSQPVIVDGVCTHPVIREQTTLA